MRGVIGRCMRCLFRRLLGNERGVVVGCLAAGKRRDYAFSRALQRLPCSAFSSRATAVARVRELP